jgi:hypothetical protein
MRGGRTDNEGNHRSSITTSGFKTLDQLLDLPDLNVLLRLSLLLLLLGAHLGRSAGDPQSIERVSMAFPVNARQNEKPTTDKDWGFG